MTYERAKEFAEFNLELNLKVLVDKCNRLNADFLNNGHVFIILQYTINQLYYI